MAKKPNFVASAQELATSAEVTTPSSSVPFDVDGREDLDEVEYPQASSPPLIMRPMPEPEPEPEPEPTPESHAVPAVREQRKIIIPPSSLNLPAAIPNYSVAMQDPALLQEIVLSNLGTGNMRVFDLQWVKVPPGGITSWQIASADGVTSANEIEGVIVAWTQPRSYWKVPFDEREGAGTPPDCTAEDGMNGKGVPGGSCLRCPLAKFGSAPKGKGQACRQARLLFVMRPNSALPCVIKAPATSIRGLQQYFIGLIDKTLAYHHVVTKFILERAKNERGIDYSKITPSMRAPLNAEEIEKIGQYMRVFQPLVQEAARDAQTFED